MDKLIKYIEQRIKKYGHVKSEQCMSSNYYKFNAGVIRISDHIKYGMDTMNTFDYNFIIQPDDTYIFSKSPKHNEKLMNKMFLKIVSLEEAKLFIRRIHDMSISLDNMCEIYQPEGWNRGDTTCEKPSWEDFCSIHIDGLEDIKKISILDMIERIKTGINSKGGVAVKMERVSKLYDKLSVVQYETLLNKLNK